MDGMKGSNLLNLPSPTADYRGFRLNRIWEPEYRHVLYWLFWPVYGLRYLLIENCNPADCYFPIHCPLDDVIPFREEFVIPYVFWYVFIFGMHLFTFFYDVDTFKRYSKFWILSISVSTAIYLLFPNCQNLRPETYPRDNFLTGLVTLLHRMDTNTNVCPSEHVIGSIAVFAAAWNCKVLRTPGRIMCIGILAFLTGIATVFLKQHSFVDVLAAIPVSMVVWRLCYGREDRKK